MMDFALFNTHFIGFYLSIGIMLIKLLLFYSFKTSNWKFKNILYFDLKHIMQSTSKASEQHKRIQNFLTIASIITFSASIVLFVLIG